MKIRQCFIFLSFLLTVNSLEKARYDNYKVYKITIANDRHVELLKEIENNPDGVNKIYCNG